MKRTIVPLIICLLLANAVTAQIRTRRMNNSALNTDQQPLVIVDSVITDFTHLLLQADNIISIDVLKDSASVAFYGDMAKYGVLIIHTKKNADIVRLNEVLNYYSIPAEDRKLKVCIDNIMIREVSRFVADKSEIQTVQVITDICWISPVEAGPEERYINIVTKKGRKPF